MTIFVADSNLLGNVLYSSRCLGISARYLHATLQTMSLWTSVLVLLQLFCGERADAMRQCQANWLECIDGLSLGSPTVNIPAGLNKKTVPRQVPIPIDVANTVTSIFLSMFKGFLFFFWIEQENRAPTGPDSNGRG